MVELLVLFMTEYGLTFVSSIPDPLSDVEHDNRTIRNFYHISEMQSISGQNNVRYGGESPWVHAWRGTISNPDEIDALELSEDASTRERIEHEVDRLMTFLVSESATPNRTSPSDFKWSVYVHESDDCNPVVLGRMVQVVWRPKEM